MTMNTLTKSYTLALTSILIVSCRNDNDGASSDGIRSQLNTLSTQVAQIGSKQPDITGLNSRLTAVENNLWAMKKVSEWSHLATFDPITSQGYNLMDVGVTKLAISVEDVQPFADGVKVTLSVGNTSTAVFDGVKATYSYGPASDKISEMGYENWQKLQRTKSLDVPAAILPARWNRLVLTLPGIKTDELGRLELKLETNHIRFQVP